MMIKVLAKMLHDTKGERVEVHDCPLARRALATPEGRALDALVEAALAWAAIAPDDPGADRPLRRAIDHYREVTR